MTSDVPSCAPAGRRGRRQSINKKSARQQVGRSGDNRPQQRRMEGEDERDDRGRHQGQARALRKDPNHKPATSASTPAASNAGAGVPSAKSQRNKSRWQGTAVSDRPQRYGRSELRRRRPRSSRRPTAARSRRARSRFAPRAQRASAPSHERECSERHCGGQTRSRARSPRRRIRLRCTGRRRAVSSPRRTDRAAAARAPYRRRSKSAPSSRTA